MIHVLRPVFATALVSLTIAGCAQLQGGTSKGTKIGTSQVSPATLPPGSPADNMPPRPMRFTLSGSTFATFTCVVDGPFRKTTIVPANRLQKAKGFLRSEIVSVEFVPATHAYEGDVVVVNETRLRRPMKFRFPRGAFTEYGVHNQNVGVTAVLTVEKVSGASVASHDGPTSQGS